MVASQLGVKATTGTFKDYVRELTRAKMIERHGAAVRAADWLFLEG